MSNDNLDYNGGNTRVSQKAIASGFDVYSKDKVDTLLSELRSNIGDAFASIDVASIDNMTHSQQTNLLKLVVSTLQQLSHIGG